MKISSNASSLRINLAVWPTPRTPHPAMLTRAIADIVKLSILSADIEDCYDLGLFVRDYRRQRTKPLLAVGMGSKGQLSRITSPISLVTHPLLPFPSALGQLSLAVVHRARHLLGLLPAKNFHVTSPESFVQTASQALQAAFDELGYPYSCIVKDSSKSGVTAFSVTDFKSVCSRYTEWTGRPAPEFVIQRILS